MESARAVASTAKILEAVRADAQLQNRLKLDGLAGIEDYPEFKKQWQEHLFLFGDRCLEELKLETETFRVKPDKFLQMILGYAANHTDLAKLVKGDEARRLRAEREVSPLLASRPLFKKVFEFTLARARQCMINRENSRLDRARMFGILRSIARQMGEVLTRQKILATPSEVFWLEFGELEKFADQRLPRETLSVLLTQRKAQWKVFESMNPEDRFWIFDSVDNSPIPQKRALSQQLQNQKVLQGLGSSAGIARAESLVILSADVAAPARGKILVAPMTDPGWVFLMVAAKGLVSERGSILSHTAIIGRELGIPTVVNVKEVTRIVKSGQQIQINGTTGTVEIL